MAVGVKVGSGVGVGVCVGVLLGVKVDVGVGVALGVKAGSGVGVGVGPGLTDRLQLNVRKPIRSRENTRKQQFGFCSIVKILLKRDLSYFRQSRSARPFFVLGPSAFKHI